MIRVLHAVVADDSGHSPSFGSSLDGGAEPGCQDATCRRSCVRRDVSYEVVLDRRGDDRSQSIGAARRARAGRCSGQPYVSRSPWCRWAI